MSSPLLAIASTLDGILDWGRNKVNRQPFHQLPPCRICRKPAIMNDGNGVPCHKVCAEASE